MLAIPHNRRETREGGPADASTERSPDTRPVHYSPSSNTVQHCTVDTTYFMKAPLLVVVSHKLPGSL